MVSKWRHLVWAVPLGFVALILVLAWRQDRDFWRSTPALMRLAQDAARRGDYARGPGTGPQGHGPGAQECPISPGTRPDSSGGRAAATGPGSQPPAQPQDAKSSQALTLQARALDLLGDRQAALDLLAEGLKDNPDDPEMLALAATLAAQGNYDRPLAITYYQRLYQLTRDPLVRRQLVELLISLNRFPEAIPLQEEEAAQFPDDPRPCTTWPCSIIGSGTTRRPAMIYQRLLEKAADDAALRLEAARTAEAGQQLDQALAHYLWLYSRSRGEKEYALALARLWARKGNHAEAAGVLAPLMQENPDPALRRRYGLELLLIGDLRGGPEGLPGRLEGRGHPPGNHHQPGPPLGPERPLRQGRGHVG